MGVKELSAYIFFGNCEEELPKKPVDQQSTDRLRKKKNCVNVSRTSYRQVTDTLPTVGQQVAYISGKTCRPTVGRQVFWGALLHNYRQATNYRSGKIMFSRFNVHHNL